MIFLTFTSISPRRKVMFQPQRILGTQKENALHLLFIPKEKILSALGALTVQNFLFNFSECIQVFMCREFLQESTEKTLEIINHPDIVTEF